MSYVCRKLVLSIQKYSCICHLPHHMSPDSHIDIASCTRCHSDPQDILEQSQSLINNVHSKLNELLTFYHFQLLMNI